MPVGYTHQFPATFDGRARMNVQNLLAAVAACHVSGAHLHDIRHGLRTFTTDFFQAPGRLNLVDLGGVTVLLDYAHNAAGLQMVGDFVERMTSEPPPAHPGEPSWSANLRVAVVATAGDRREDMRELGQTPPATSAGDRPGRTRGRDRGDRLAGCRASTRPARRAPASARPS
jgi:cyanophycin synthetase